MVWRNLVDPVAHARSRFLVSWASQMGLPTTWKGDGRVTDGRLSVAWGPLKHPIALNAVFLAGLLKGCMRKCTAK